MDTAAGSEWERQIGRGAAEAPSVDPLFVLENSHSINLVDLRAPEEATGLLGHIPGSLFLSEDNLSSLAAQAEDRMPVVLLSASGARAAAKARHLTDLGVAGIAAMRGGLAAWRREGFGTSRQPVDAAEGLRPRARGNAAPTGDARRLLTLEDVRHHLGDPRNVQWLQMASLLFKAHISCVDGRDARGVIGSVGGDAGEFVLALAAVERVAGKTLTEDEIQQTLVAHIDTFGDFYMHSDEGALEALVAALRTDPVIGPATTSIRARAGWIEFLKKPDPSVEAALLEHLAVPAHVGCGHLRLMLQHSDEYGVRKGLVEGVVRSFSRLMWAGAAELPFVVLPGGHGEGAVVNIRLAEEPWALGFVPVISPAYEGTSIFVNHPDVAAVLRGSAVMFHSRGVTPASVEPSLAGALERELDRLAARQLSATLDHLAKGLPIYDVVFAPDGSFDVKATA